MHLQTEALRDTWKRLCCFETCSVSGSFFRTQNPSSIRRSQRYVKALLDRPGAILGGLKAVMGASGRSVGFLGRLQTALRDFLGCLGRSGWSWGGLGGSWGALGGVLGTSWAVLLRSWDALGGLGVGPGGLWGGIGRSWGDPGGSWGLLGGSWGDLGDILGASWGVLGAFRTVLGPSWALLWRSLGHLGRSWAVLGAQNRSQKQSQIDLRKKHPKNRSWKHFLLILGSQVRRSRGIRVFLLATMDAS